MTCSQIWPKNAGLFNLVSLYVLFILLRVECAELGMISMKKCKSADFALLKFVFCLKTKIVLQLQINVTKYCHSSLLWFCVWDGTIDVFSILSLVNTNTRGKDVSTLLYTCFSFFDQFLFVLAKFFRLEFHHSR